MQDYKVGQSHLARLSAIHEHLLHSLHHMAMPIIQLLQHNVRACVYVRVCVSVSSEVIPLQGEQDDHINTNNGHVVISSFKNITLFFSDLLH